jgi:peptidoglycan/LPS O-acetylase OafA/YrhL
VPVSTPPINVRRAGAIVAIEGAAFIVYAIVAVIRELMGHEEEVISGYGTAAWFAILGGGVFAGGVALLVGRRWGRAIAVIAQILLLPFAFALLTDSDLPILGTPILIALVAALVFLFSPSSMNWFAEAYVIDGPDDDAKEPAAEAAPVQPKRHPPRKKRRR